jgi:uncharacterized delta-60 repeat protein
MTLIFTSCGKGIDFEEARRAGSRSNNGVIVNINGTLDLSFNSVGYKTINSIEGGPNDDRLYDAHILSSGNYVTVGHTNNGGGVKHNLIAEILEDGSGLNTGFGTSSGTTYSAGANSIFYEIHALENGKYLACGYEHTGSWSASLYRFNNNGTVDGTFATAGDYNDTGTNSYFYGMTVDSSGNILTTGKRGLITKVVVFRFDPNGALDTSWDTDGILSFNSIGDVGATAYEVGKDIIISQDNQYVVFGQAHDAADYKMMAFKIDSTTGALDTSFNTNGKFIHGGAAGGSGPDIAEEAIELDDGSFVIVGSSHNGSDLDMTMWKLTANGALDTSFGGGNGYVVYSNVGEDRGYSIAEQRDGKLVIAGYIDNGTDLDMAVWRYNANGTIDTTFGSAGIFTHDNATGGVVGDDRANRVKIQDDDKIIIIGESRRFSGSNYPTIAIWRLE